MTKLACLINLSRRACAGARFPVRMWRTHGLDPLTPTTSKAWGPLPAPADENAGCEPPSPQRGEGRGCRWGGSKCRNSSERRSFSAQQAAKSQVTGQWPNRNLDRSGQRPPLQQTETLPQVDKKRGGRPIPLLYCRDKSLAPEGQAKNRPKAKDLETEPQTELDQARQVVLRTDHAKGAAA